VPTLNYLWCSAENTPILTNLILGIIQKFNDLMKNNILGKKMANKKNIYHALPMCEHWPVWGTVA
jgi:hypothetical protein